MIKIKPFKLRYYDRRLGLMWERFPGSSWTWKLTIYFWAYGLQFLKRYYD